MFHAHPDAVYIGDNGRCLCGEHLGYTAQMTGHDLSGQRIYRITPRDYMEAGPGILGSPDILSCEQCGKPASRLWKPTR